MNTFFVENWVLIVTNVITPVLTFFTTRRLNENKLDKLKTELENLKIVNVSKNLEIYQEIIDDLNEKFKERINEYALEIDELKTLNEELRKLVRDQGRIISRLEEKLAKYEKPE